MRKHIGFIFVICSVLFGILNGCQNQFKPTPVTHQNSLLWQISKSGEPTSYMFGTMHMISKEHYDFTSNLTSIISNSDAVIMELSGMPNPIKAMLLMTNKNGALTDIFTHDEWQTILDFYRDEFNMTESSFIRTYNNFKPFFLLQSLLQSYFEADAESYDMNIMALAKEHNKELIGLETIDQQIGFFDAIPAKEMANMIIESIKTFEEDKAEFKKLENLYSQQKVDEFIPLMKEQSPEFLKYEVIFLTNRNKAWVPKLVNELKLKSCFIAVGAAHLFDENGLITLLKAEGYRVTPIKK